MSNEEVKQTKEKKKQEKLEAKTAQNELEKTLDAVIKGDETLKFGVLKNAEKILDNKKWEEILNDINNNYLKKITINKEKGNITINYTDKTQKETTVQKVRENLENIERLIDAMRPTSLKNLQGINTITTAIEVKRKEVYKFERGQIIKDLIKDNEKNLKPNKDDENKFTYETKENQNIKLNDMIANTTQKKTIDITIDGDIKNDDLKNHITERMNNADISTTILDLNYDPKKNEYNYLGNIFAAKNLTQEQIISQINKFKAKEEITLQETDMDTRYLNISNLYDKTNNNFNYYGKIITIAEIKGDNETTEKQNLDKKISILKTELNEKMKGILASPDNHDYALDFFEKQDEGLYNYVFDQVYKNTQTIKFDPAFDNTKTLDLQNQKNIEQNFFRLLMTYAKVGPDKMADKIAEQIVDQTVTLNAATADKYADETRFIKFQKNDTYKLEKDGSTTILGKKIEWTGTDLKIDGTTTAFATNNEYVDIQGLKITKNATDNTITIIHPKTIEESQGTQETMQERIAKKTEQTDKGLRTKGVDLTKLINFDNKGNFKAFEHYINFKKQSDPDFLIHNLPQIMEGIKNYTPDKEKPGNIDINQDINQLRNGYATTLKNLIISSNNGDLMKAYIKYLTPANSIYLGADKETQTENFKKLVDSNLYKSIEKGLDETTKKNFLDLRMQIENTNKKTLQEAMKSNLDNAIKQFGSMILSVIEFFGGKGAIKSFCKNFGIDYDKYFNQLDKLYEDTYALDESKTQFLKKLYDTKPDNKRDGPDEDIKDLNLKAIKYDKELIKQSYRDKLEGDIKNFNLLDSGLVNDAMKKNNIINNTVFTKEKVNGAIVNKINPNNNLSEKDKKTIIEEIVEDKNIRSEIQKAGNSISRSDYVYSTDTKNPTELDNAKQMQNVKGLHNATDIGMYFGAYIMKGSSDLKYTISENELPNEKDRLKEYNTNKEQTKDEKEKKTETPEGIAKNKKAEETKKTL